jgi:N-acetylglutamate synthase-like GNAT family acetyltransferase
MKASSCEIQVRRAKPEDAASVAKVLHESFVQYEGLYTPEGFAATTPNTEEILVRMRQGPVWIALRTGVVIGTFAAVVKRDSLYMRGMAVLPVARKLGVGAQLLKQVESCASEKGCSCIVLSTTPFLTVAIHLYEEFGFRRVNEDPQHLFGTPLFTMEKRVLQLE